MMSTVRFNFRSTIFGIFLMAFCHACLAGLFDDDEARKAILDLRQKVDAVEQARSKDAQTLQQNMREENAQLKRSLLDLQTQIEQLRGDFSKQVGQNEQLAKDVSELQRRQRDLAQGVDDRMRRLEPIKVTPDDTEFLADPAEAKEFDAALAMLRKSDFKAAAQAFTEFLRRYPQSGYQAIGLFWLGNAQYANRDYRMALTYFKSALSAKLSPSKASEALLAMANSQLELKETRAAKTTLTELVKLYPKSEAAVAANDRLTKLK